MLKPKQVIFCIEYAKSGNAKSAYMLAYGTRNEKSASVSAHKLLQREEIKIRIKELEKEIMTEKICEAQKTQERLSAIARREIRDTIVLPNGKLSRRLEM